jgi:hypothetical protein
MNASLPREPKSGGCEASACGYNRRAAANVCENCGAKQKHKINKIERCVDGKGVVTATLVDATVAKRFAILDRVGIHILWSYHFGIRVSATFAKLCKYRI